MKYLKLLLIIFLLIGCQKEEETYNDYACMISVGSGSYIHLLLNEEYFKLSLRRNDTAEEKAPMYGKLVYLSDNIMYLEVDESIQKGYIPFFLKIDEYGFYHLFDLNATIPEDEYGYDGGKLLKDYEWDKKQIVEIGETVNDRNSYKGYECIKLPEIK